MQVDAAPRDFPPVTLRDASAAAPDRFAGPESGDMAQVDFYVVGSGGSEGAARVACKVTEKAWRQGLRVFVRTVSENDARRMDDLLWTFRQDSFVPHGLAGESGAEKEAVVIGCQPQADDGREVLVNLGAGLQADPSAYERIAEVVSDDEGARIAARERYGVYRRLGHELKHHDVQP